MLFILIVLLVYITQYIFAHWWLIAVNAFVASVILARSGWNAFFSGFFAVVVVWLFQSFILNYWNESLLLSKISKLFTVPAPYIFVITVVLGGFIAGLSALTGYYLKSLFKK